MFRHFKNVSRESKNGLGDHIDVTYTSGNSDLPPPVQGGLFHKQKKIVNPWLFETMSWWSPIQEFNLPRKIKLRVFKVVMTWSVTASEGWFCAAAWHSCGKMIHRTLMIMNHQGVVSKEAVWWNLAAPEVSYILSWTQVWLLERTQIHQMSLMVSAGLLLQDLF